MTAIETEMSRIISVFIVHQIFTLARDWSKTGEYLNDIPQFQFQKSGCCENYLKDHNSLHLPRKFVRIFALGHYLFFKAQGVRFSEQMMPADKYPRQLEAIVYELHN